MSAQWISFLNQKIVRWKKRARKTYGEHQGSLGTIVCVLMIYDFFHQLRWGHPDGKFRSVSERRKKARNRGKHGSPKASLAAREAIARFVNGNARAAVGLAG